MALAAGAMGGGGAGLADGGPASAPRIVEGDILVARAGFRGVGTISRERRWSNGEIPYRVEPSLPSRTRRAIEDAVERWNAVAGITLTAVAPGSTPPVDHLVFQSGPGCASWVGRQGGAQAVWIGPSCTSGSVMHEIGHAIGLEHEHTRSDRDAHVRVLWDNVVPEKRHNFALAPESARTLGDYDVGSIMHYGSGNFSVDGGPTLEALDPEAGRTMGQREAPSAGDVAAVARLYASDLALSLDVDAAPASPVITLFVTNHHSQGAHDVRVTLGSAADGLEARRVGGDEGWDCAGEDGRVECRLGRLPGDAVSRVVLALDGSPDAAALRASVASKTPDLDPDNNRDRGADEPSVALGAAMLGDGAPEPVPGRVPEDASGTGGGTLGPLASLALALLGGLRRRAARG